MKAYLGRKINKVLVRFTWQLLSDGCFPSGKQSHLPKVKSTLKINKVSQISLSIHIVIIWIYAKRDSKLSETETWKGNGTRKKTMKNKGGKQPDDPL